MIATNPVMPHLTRVNVNVSASVSVSRPNEVVYVWPNVAVDDANYLHLFTFILGVFGVLS